MAEQYTHRHAIEEWKHFPIDKSGYESDENQFSNKAIVRQLLSARSVLIQEALKSGKHLTEFMVQTLPCIEVEEMDRNECPCAPASGCYWLKAKVRLPKFCKIVSVTGIVANAENPRFSFIKWDRFQYIPDSRIESNKRGRYWTIRDNDQGEGPTLYLYGDRFLKTVAISGIFEDPMEAAAFPSCGKENIDAKCNPLDVDFHTDAWMRDSLFTLTWQRLLPVRQSAPHDRVNDDTSSNNAPTARS